MSTTTDDFARVYFIVEENNTTAKEFVQIPKDALISDLRVTVALRHKRDGRLRLWKPFLVLGDDQANLIARLDEVDGDFATFCNDLSKARAAVVIAEVLRVIQAQEKGWKPGWGRQRPVGKLQENNSWRTIASVLHLSAAYWPITRQFKAVKHRYRAMDGANTLGLPIGIIHPAFAKFRALIADVSEKLPEELVESTAKLMASASVMSTANALCQQLLHDLLSYGVKQPTVSADHFSLYVRTDKLLGVASDVVQRKSYRQVMLLPIIRNSRAIDDERVFQVARVFHALRWSVHDLRDFYARLVAAVAPKSSQIADSRFFPVATTYMDNEGKRIKFRYLRPLKGDDPSCKTFLVTAVEDPSQLLVVKFVERYCEEAHKTFMREGRAPELLYCGTVWLDNPERNECGWRKMVVMEYVLGRVAVDGVSASVRQAVQDTVSILHRHDLVHGDARRPNILVAKAMAW
ncbi:hypothetical protein VNI00_007813 [Paramarasmius palmivorus]|uniref:Protein kinase domain-containing protein n=1 Tax=Paramarasmius palmivorus TaxID=297713 RepID=A0AAW0CVA8_9AGAR